MVFINDNELCVVVDGVHLRGRCCKIRIYTAVDYNSLCLLIDDIIMNIRHSVGDGHEDRSTHIHIGRCFPRLTKTYKRLFLCSQIKTVVGVVHLPRDTVGTVWRDLSENLAKRKTLNGFGPGSL